MTTQPEALRLAQEITVLFVSQWGMHSPMAKDSKIVLEELRRLHALNGELLEALKQIAATKNLAKELEAEWCPAATSMVWVARAAIAKAEGKV